MAGPTDLNRQIGAVRDSMESSIVVLRDRGKRELKRVEKAALIAAGVGAAAGVVLVGLLVIHRLQRPPTRRERIERVIPLGWWDRLQTRVQRGVASQLPPMQIAIGEEKVKEAHRPRWEATASTLARSLGAGIGSAVATRVATIVFTRLAERGQKQQP